MSIPTIPVDPCVLVIFGASGDLTARKLVPAMYEMAKAGLLPSNTRILGVARRQKTDDQWRQELEPWLARHDDGIDQEVWRDIASRIHYQPADATTVSGMDAVARRVAELNRSADTAGNVLFFLSVASSLYEPIVERIAAANLVVEGKRWCSIDQSNASWQRIIVEKPFGEDDQTARALNRTLGRAFEEESIYRIDHYLAKEIVQSLLVFRFANILWEPVWNQQYIDHVQISAAETVGVGQRTGFYDQTGAIRDMIQSHLFQVLAFVAMEPPTDYTPGHIRNEKVKVTDAIAMTPRDRVAEYCALGQYAADGADDPGYAASEGVAPGSTTETFAALHLQFENWRWAGTPFYLRSGKRMAEKRTEVVVQFKPPAANLFRKLPISADAKHLEPNRLVFSIAPEERLSLRFETKRPGMGIQIDPLEMAAALDRDPEEPVVEAYGPLIIDAMRGDQTLFKSRVEVESAWDAVMPFLDEASAEARRDIHDNYAPGSWGPDSAKAMLARHGRRWHEEDRS
ncbi:MAG: glucose-6-phosphate dehydrogenase [Planctomycetaceae bacterium]|nr:glucose-6-phosphate dehydrogenase [Planctomycetaceae bacterium]